MSFSSNIKSQLESLEIKRDCCKNSFERGKSLGRLNESCNLDAGCFLRGAFLRCGSVSAPGRNFMLSFSVGDESFMSYLSEFLEFYGFPPKLTLRRGKRVIYYRASESIEDLLSFMGATKAVLDILSTKVLSDVRNSTNRLCNAETANLVRATRAAAEQCEAIKVIQKYGAFDNLAPELRECATIRLENPEMSLTQIREMLREPVSKSGLNHRYKKLIEIAEMLKNN